MKRTYKRQPDTYLDYRIPMLITQIYVYRSGNGYYVCPKCQTTLEREFSAYCDRCGQCLNWSAYKQAKPLYVPELK